MKSTVLVSCESLIYSKSVTISDPPAEGARALLMNDVIDKLGLWSVEHTKKCWRWSFLVDLYLWMLEIRF